MPDLTTISAAARKIARERLDATAAMPPGTHVNIAIQAGDLRTLAAAVPASSDESLREIAAGFVRSVVGINPESEVAVSARSIAEICAVLPLTPPI
jgi:hypothetical protein